MSQLRRIERVHHAVRADIDDLVTWRALPMPSVPSAALEPFLFLNHHGHQTYAPGNSGLPFGPHPHRGFETVTFILAGELLHEDSGGYRSVIRAGGVQWMTAGSGLIHAELSPEEFLERGGDLEILQLWLNLPSRLKMTPPRYTGVQREEVPSISLDDGRVTLSAVSGAWHGTPGAIASLTDAQLCTLALRDGGQASFEIASEREVFFYVARGAVEVNGARAEARQLVQFAADGARVELQARAESVVLLGHAPRNGEPVVAYGPFVMNTEAEIHQAIRDYQAGMFGVWRG